MAKWVESVWERLYDEYLDWRVDFDLFCDACADVRKARRMDRKMRGNKSENQHVVSRVEIAKSWRRLYFRTLFGKGM